MQDKPWLKFYDPGVPESITYPSITIPEMLKQSARLYADKTCTVFKKRKISFQDMDKLSSTLAVGLAESGLQKGQRVGILLTNSSDFVVVFLAILKAGGVVVAINTMFTPTEIIHQVNDSQVQFLFTSSSYYQKAKDLQPNTRIQKVIVTDKKIRVLNGDDLISSMVKTHRNSFPVAVKLDPDDPAIFQYSGGTTGISKGAVGLHRNLVANVIQFRHWLVDTSEGKEVNLVAIPLFHVYGMVLGMLLSIYMGATMVLIENPRDIRDILFYIKKYKATIFPGVPTLYNAINQHKDALSGKIDLRSIKACISGSAPLLQETKNRFEAITGGKLMEGYGLSEAPTATHCNPMIGENRPGSIGLPLPDVEARIVNLEDGMTVLAAEELGELVISGPQVMEKYHNNPMDTRDTIKDGWLYTGDIAYMDKDGFFYIVDRKKDLIKSGGFQVWPREIEEVLKKHPGVVEVSAAGIPDKYRGETVKVWIVLKPGYAPSKEELLQFCRKELAAYKIPAEIAFRDQLPKTPVGKVLRRELVQQHLREMQLVKNQPK